MQLSWSQIVAPPEAVFCLLGSTDQVRLLGRLYGFPCLLGQVNFSFVFLSVAVLPCPIPTLSDPSQLSCYCQQAKEFATLSILGAGWKEILNTELAMWQRLLYFTSKVAELFIALLFSSLRRKLFL